MVYVIIIFAIIAAIWWSRANGRRRIVSQPLADLSILPPHFVVFDLETTGLDPSRHEIIEIGAIRVNRDSNIHETFQALVIPTGRISAKITQLTGLTREILKRDGQPISNALIEFRAFVGDLPLVAFNAEFDQGFLRATCANLSVDNLKNETYCVLKMARRAWPDRKSYRLASLAADGGLSDENTHRALGDCQRTMIVYAAAARRLKSYK